MYNLNWREKRIFSDWFKDSHNKDSELPTNIYVFILSVVSDYMAPWTVAFQASLSMRNLQAGILEWVATPSSRGSSQPRDWAQVSCIAGGFFTIWATREVQYICIVKQHIHDTNKWADEKQTLRISHKRLWKYTCGLVADSSR